MKCVPRSLTNQSALTDLGNESCTSKKTVRLGPIVIRTSAFLPCLASADSDTSSLFNAIDK